MDIIKANIDLFLSILNHNNPSLKSSRLVVIAQFQMWYPVIPQGASSLKTLVPAVLIVNLNQIIKITWQWNKIKIIIS
jgi:fibronectin type 3 domain-containing protein